MTVSGVTSNSATNPSYGHNVPGGTYIPKSYEEILADREGKTVWWKDISEAEAEKKKFMTIAEMQARRAEHAPVKEATTGANGLHKLTPEELARFSGRYREGMPREELDALLVELLDLGAITEQDRMIALGFRPIEGNFANKSISTVLQYDRSVTFDELHNRDDLRSTLKNYEEFLWRQAKAMEYDGQDYSFLTDLTGSCQRLMDILAALSVRNGIF